MSKPRPGLLILIAGSALDSLSGVLTRLTQSDGFTTASARGLIAFGFLFAVMAVQGRPLQRLLGVGRWGLVFVAFNATGTMLNSLALKYTAVANFFMIFATAPFLAALAGWVVLRERPDRATLAAACAGILGIGIMVSGGLTGVNLGDILALVVVLAYCANVLVLRSAPKIEVLPIVALTVLFSGLFAAPFATFAGLQTSDWMALTALGVVQLGLGSLLIFTAVARVTAAEAGLLGILGAVFAPTWVLIGLGEVPPPATLAGGAVILAAALAHFLWTLRRAPNPA